MRIKWLKKEMVDGQGYFELARMDGFRNLQIEIEM
jgi:hypothetical protein